MGAAGRKRAIEQFTWDKVVDRCLDIYSGALREESRAESDRLR
jgi:hypothetical protein